MRRRVIELFLDKSLGFQSQTQNFTAIFDALFEFGLLKLLLGQFSVFTFGNLESFDSAPAFGHQGESEEFFSAYVAIIFPEFVFLKREWPDRAGDDFELDAHAGANCGEAVEIFLPVNLPFAHRRPGHRRAFARLPDHRIANAGRRGVRAEDLQILHRVFEGPRGVAGIHRRADVIAPALFDQAGELPRLHIARVVFDGDLHARVNGPAADRLADADRILPSSFESSGEFAVIGRALITAGGRRAQGFRHADQ